MHTRRTKSPDADFWGNFAKTLRKLTFPVREFQGDSMKFIFVGKSDKH